MILAKSFQFKSQLVHQKVKLNIPQLTLAKLSQSGRHQNGSQEVSASIPTGGSLFC